MKKHYALLFSGATLIILGIAVFPICFFVFKGFHSSFLSVRQSDEISTYSKNIEIGDDSDDGFLETLAEKVGIKKLRAKIINVIAEQKRIKEGFTEAFSYLQEELEILFSLLSVFLIFFAILSSLPLISLGIALIFIRKLLVGQEQILCLPNS